MWFKECQKCGNLTDGVCKFCRDCKKDTECLSSQLGVCFSGANWDDNCSKYQEIRTAGFTGDSKEEPKGLKYDTDKLRYDLVPPIALKAVAEVLTFGAKKYKANSWQELEDFTARYTAALFRHIEGWRGGEGIDSESGLPHLWHALCNLVFLIWKESTK